MTIRNDVSETAFTMALSVAARKMRNVFDARVRSHGLTLARARALQYLARQTNVSQRELADYLEIEHPSVVRLLDGLERQGLIVRQAMEGDKRAKRIELTAASRDLVKDLEDITKAMRKELLDGVDQKSLDTTLAVLHRVAEMGDRILSTPAD